MDLPHACDHSFLGLSRFPSPSPSSTGQNRRDRRKPRFGAVPARASPKAGSTDHHAVCPERTRRERQDFSLAVWRLRHETAAVATVPSTSLSSTFWFLTTSRARARGVTTGRYQIQTSHRLRKYWARHEMRSSMLKVQATGPSADCLARLHHYALYDECFGKAMVPQPSKLSSKLCARGGHVAMFRKEMLT